MGSVSGIDRYTKPRHQYPYRDWKSQIGASLLSGVHEDHESHTNLFFYLTDFCLSVKVFNHCVVDKLRFFFFTADIFSFCSRKSTYLNNKIFDGWIPFHWFSLRVCVIVHAVRARIVPVLIPLLTTVLH